MTGTLLGKPVKYRARGERILQGGFLRLHMIDAADPPTMSSITAVSTPSFSASSDCESAGSDFAAIAIVIHPA